MLSAPFTSCFLWVLPRLVLLRLILIRPLPASTDSTSSAFCLILAPPACANISFQALGPKRTILPSTRWESIVQQLSVRRIHIRLLFFRLLRLL